MGEWGWPWGGARTRRSGDQHEGGGAEGQRVARAAALEEQGRHEAAGPERGQPAGDDADHGQREAAHGQREAAHEHEAQEVRRLGAEGAADAELEFALAHAEGDNRVEAESGEQQGEQGGGAQRASWSRRSAGPQLQLSRVSSRINGTLPKSRSAAGCASSGDIPAAIRSSTSIAR